MGRVAPFEAAKGVGRVLDLEADSVTSTVVVGRVIGVVCFGIGADSVVAKVNGLVGADVIVELRAMNIGRHDPPIATL